MQITKEQQEVLDTFTCERLTSHEENRQLIESFDSEKGKPIVAYLKKDAWQEDKAGISAVYLVKNSDGIPCMYFAIKCGALFQPLNEDEIKKEYVAAREIIQSLKTHTGGDSSPEKIQDALEAMRLQRNISAPEIIEEVVLASQTKTNLGRAIRMIENDKAREGARPIQRVSTIYPGVEITHFCTNDNNKAFWNTYNIRYPMGEVLFWHFVPPIITSIRTIVGCQFAFLFAADSTPDGNLTNYYNTQLKFSKLADVGTSKPYYDFCCEFMSEEISEMELNRAAFFDGFNTDPDDVIA